jgi:hypothetical protein
MGQTQKKGQKRWAWRPVDELDVEGGVGYEKREEAIEDAERCIYALFRKRPDLLWVHPSARVVEVGQVCAATVGVDAKGIWNWVEEGVEDQVAVFSPRGKAAVLEDAGAAIGELQRFLDRWVMRWVRVSKLDWVQSPEKIEIRVPGSEYGLDVIYQKFLGLPALRRMEILVKHKQHVIIKNREEWLNERCADLLWRMYGAGVIDALRKDVLEEEAGDKT